MRWWLIATVAMLGGCVSSGTTTEDPSRQEAAWKWDLPSYFPTPRVPTDNPMSETKFQLGRALFYDPRLSGNGQQSCASCHHQDKAFTDGLSTSPGSTGELTHRNAQALANSAWHSTYTWANPALVTLEQQMAVPMFGTDPVEMGVNDSNRDIVLSRLRSDSNYASQFAKAFPDDANPMHFGNIIKAIATFQRGLISADSKYDRYLQKRATLSETETRGMNLFFGEQAECFHCHGSFNFNDQIVHAASRDLEIAFHNTGLYNIDGKGGFPFPNRGIFEFTGLASDMGKFRAPTLRNVAVTGPYMHDGTMKTLEEVLDFYAAGGRVITSGPNTGDGRYNPNKSDLIVRIQLSDQDKQDLIAFLKILTDENLLTNPRFSNPRQP
ncbi:methanobactin export MATE transporter MbnM [Chitinimonas sp. BJB300]|uniref:methanobactin export MATE transporter MbnM n=1 Tax=Chitinimonas sp. BJB300 TaxID=1559339 RepID=UPI000C0F1671|nr:methanobactin export MATE transporter MbnM [Chitinimonas sp. BJB300]PHV11054.1 di-heme enzyme [Chitinimonas sp. BJB300]TSJ90082.1 di-heme enzyme [Chitinimonas sp. BJB300]